jgi:hypothetical protein
MSRPPLDPVRGAEVATALRGLRVKGPLIKAAELGYITELRCGMRKCFCPEELGGVSKFAPRADKWNDWEPTFEHHPIPKAQGGRFTPDNAVLAHRLCNKLDHSIGKGLSIEKDLARVEQARLEAVARAAANLASKVAARPLAQVQRAATSRPDPDAEASGPRAGPPPPARVGPAAKAANAKATEAEADGPEADEPF